MPGLARQHKRQAEIRMGLSGALSSIASGARPSTQMPDV